MDSRTWLNTAADGLLDILPGLTAHLDDPGVGDWSVHALLGHTSRAFLLIEHFLDEADGLSGAPEVGTVGEYYRATRHVASDPDHDFERGPGAGEKLGDDPAAAVRDIVARVRALVDSSDDSLLVVTPAGTMTLPRYMETRAFEISVHTVDLARATRQDIPAATMSTLDACLALVADVATDTEKLELLRAATGREQLRESFCLV